MGAAPGEGTQDAYWERAGHLGYGDAQFRSRRVAAHVLGRQWQAALDTARRLGLGETAEVLELGCGDGEFATAVLARHFRRVDALDKSRAAIERAAGRGAGPHVRFAACDVTTHEYAPGQRWDGAFLVGFLHHVKREAPLVVRRLAAVAPRAVVLEPSGDNPIRRGLERLPAYRAAGEASFRRAELVAMFAAAGFRLVTESSVNLFPPFTPDACFRIVRALERVVERAPALRGLCSSRMLGFVREG